MALKPTSKDMAVQVVWHEDPAIDHDKSSDVEDYMQEVYKNPACWRDMLKFKDGQRPTIFHVGVIAPGELSIIEDECGVGRGSVKFHRLQWLCFLHCLRRLDDFPGESVLENGKTVVRIPERDGYVDPVWLAETFSRGLRNCAQFIGGVAYRWNQLQEDEAKN